MEDLLKQISNIYNRKIQLDKPINKSNEYGLYLIPDNNFPKCDSISKGINWGGSHITLAGFTSNNKNKIEKALNHLRTIFSSQQTKRWKLMSKHIKIKWNKYEISGSDNLVRLLEVLKENGVDNYKTDLHIYCENGLPNNIDFLKNVEWSLIMIEKQGSQVKWLENTKVSFNDFTK